MKWYYNMKIGAKLIVGFVIVAIIAGIVGTIGIVNINNINNQYSRLYTEFGVALGDIADASIAFQRVRVNLRDLILAEGEDKDRYIENINKYNNEKLEALERFKGSLQTEDGKNSFSDLEEAIKAYSPIETEIIDLVNAGKYDDAVGVLRADSSSQVVSKIMEQIDKLFDLKDTTGSRLSEEYNDEAMNTITVTIVIVVIAVIIAIILGIAISRIISKPIIKMVDNAEKVADGDLDVDIRYSSKDEIGNLADAFRKMTNNLNEVMANISVAAEQVSSGSTQLSDSSMALSQGATEQASSIEELSASIEEISSQTKVNAENAKEANNITETAKLSAMEGNSQMREMLSAMEDINESSVNISKIIKVIDDIAFQTNILALNAAVEAARAGQHGKGFAVVAEEVRNLAARSANAAKETTALIEGSVKKAEGGTKIAKDTAIALDKIVEGIKSVAEYIGNIALASDEQASAIAQINQGILQVSTVVQTNSATSEESAAASEELASQAVLLEEQVSKFKLKQSKRNNTYKENNGSTGSFKSEDTVGNKGSHLEKDKKKIILSDNEFGKY